MSDYGEQVERADALAKEIMKLSQSTLMLHMRFLDMAITRLIPMSAPIETFTTNGDRFFYDARMVLSAFKDGKETMPRIYLHSLLHCIFRHMLVKNTINRSVWDLACDIAVENAINEFNIDCVKTKNVQEQISHINRLKKKVDIITAEKVYRYYIDKNLNDKEIERERKLFCLDSHDVWYLPPEGKTAKQDAQDDGDQGSQGNGDQPQNGNRFGSGSRNSRSEIEKDWQNISEKVQIDMETMSKDMGENAGSMIQQLREVNREKYDYADFLERFSVLGEAMQINDDEFDYIFYTYGLKLYENMPLIEPLEYKEVKRIKEFVIAIDTSGSTSDELVHKFLTKTYNIFKQKENFFTKINIHIIQCDAMIQEDAKITSQEEFDEYISNLKILGMGGTDFRPVFEYVDKLISEKEFTNLKGLIYFTDGCGTFPTMQPNYNTAFVFVDDKYNNYDVPIWAIKLVLQRDEI